LFINCLRNSFLTTYYIDYFIDKACKDFPGSSRPPESTLFNLLTLCHSQFICYCIVNVIKISISVTKLTFLCSYKDDLILIFSFTIYILLFKSQFLYQLFYMHHSNIFHITKQITICILIHCIFNIYYSILLIPQPSSTMNQQIYDITHTLVFYFHFIFFIFIVLDYIHKNHIRIVSKPIRISNRQIQ